jgi:hypothetical protein
MRLICLLFLYKGFKSYAVLRLWIYILTANGVILSLKYSYVIKTIGILGKGFHFGDEVRAGLDVGCFSHLIIAKCEIESYVQ